MRILVVSQYFWPENFRVNDLVKEWLQRGHEVTVLTGIPNYPQGKVFDAYRSRPDDFRQYYGARVVRVPMLPRGKGAVFLLLNYLSFALGAGTFGLWRLRNVQTDVVFVFGASPVTVGLPAVWFGQLKEVPVVYWTLDLWPETLAAVGVVRSPRVLGCVGRLVRYIYDRCTLVLGQSRSFLSGISQHCSDSKKIRYFPSWAEDIFTEGAVDPAPEVPMLPDCFNVVFAGNIGEAQDMPAILDAAESLQSHSGIRWIIVGDGRKSAWLQGEVIKRGLQDIVLLPGRFPIERMPSFYACADALLVSLKPDPVFSMTIPGKVQSYLMAGIPLLGMLDGEGATVINEANAGRTCEAGDSAGLAKAVLALLAMSPSQRQQLGQNGRRYAEAEFGRVKLMDRMESLLSEAVTYFKTNGHKYK